MSVPRCGSPEDDRRRSGAATAGESGEFHAAQEEERRRLRWLRFHEKDLVMHEIDINRNSHLIDPQLHIWGWEVPVYLFLAGWRRGS